MIVTRRRRKVFPWRQALLPLIAIGLLVFALTWSPSRNAIANGPLGPALRSSTTGFDTVAAPFHFAVQNQQITALKSQIIALQSQLTAAQSASQSKDKQVADLKAQISQLQSEAANSRASLSKPDAVSAPAEVAGSGSTSSGSTSSTFGSTASGGDLSAGATADMRRTAAYWANMEPANAAKVVQKLPISYVARVLSLMSADSAGPILDALPATVAAELTQEHPELRR